MATCLDLGGIAVDVVFKEIKNVHLSVYPPAGRVRISAPLRMSLDTVRVFAISKLCWIKQQRKKLLEQERESPREFLDLESHYVWGHRYLMKVVETERASSVNIRHRALILSVRHGADAAVKEAALADWYRQLLKAAVPPLVEAWEPRLKVSVRGLYVQRMKTKWGSCNPSAHTIRLNTELAKKPRECLEYIIVHEMAHLRDHTHGPKFLALMDQCLPNWRDTRNLLNRLPARHEDWSY